MSWSKGNSPIHKWIEEAWQLRFRQKNAQVEVALREIEKGLAQGNDLEASWQAQLLRVSLLRAAGQRVESNALLDTLQSEIAAKGSPLPFQFYLQKAINLGVADDFAVGLEFLLLGESAATTTAERMICLMNILTCLENLNIPWLDTKLKLEGLLASTPDSDLVHSVKQQFTAFLDRQDFREGRFRELFQRDLPLAVSQSHYHRLWASRVPYIKNEGLNLDGVLNYFTLNPDLHGHAYRLRTIRASPPTSGENPALVETPRHVDRIYLWTWNWLANPTPTTRARLHECLVDFDFADRQEKMTFEDFQMVRNALSWIGLFQDRMAPWIKRYLQHFSIENCAPYPLFAYEGLWIEHMRSPLDPRTRERLEAHPLHSSDQLLFKTFVERWRAEKARQSTQRSPRRGRILIDEETHRIWAAGQTQVSPTLAPILRTLAERETLTFAEALWLGFGIAPFDPAIHSAKIYNCLARAKAILPASVKLKTKCMRIYWQGAKCVIQVRDPRPLETPLGDNLFMFMRERPGERNLQHRVFSQPPHPRRVVEQAGGERLLSRERLQEIMGLSKASTVRWLKRWQVQGLIRRQGAGRAALYHFEIK